MSTTLPEKRPLWTVKELHVYLNISIPTIERMVAAEEIPSILIKNRLRRFKPEAIDQWLERKVR